MAIPITSPILFHHWRHEDVTRARFILESICEKGFLLTTNTKTLDSFAIDRGSGVVQMEVMQHPRICFTDIPFELLSSHGQSYGKYGVGFRREVIIDWGGLPAWYLPNHWGNDTLKSVGSVLVNGLHAARDTASQLQAIVKEFSAKGIPFTLKYEHGPNLEGDRLTKEVGKVADTVNLVLSFIKEMSPSPVEDCSYLMEREWRIVYGIDLAGKPSAYRVLTLEEKNKLCAQNPGWRENRRSEDINITSRFGSAPVIDSFRYFNGIPEKATVAQHIDTIIVPDQTEKSWVEDFVDQKPDLLCGNRPKVVIFPEV